MTGVQTCALPIWNWKILGLIPASNASGGLNVQTGVAYTVLATDAGKVITMSNAAAIAVTLPQATGSFGLGYKTTIQNAGSTLITVTPTVSTVNGTTALVIGPKEAATFISDGTNWLATTNNPLGIVSNATATTSGNSVSFTGIPAWAKKVVINIENVKFSALAGASTLTFRVGPNAGPVALGYLGGTLGVDSASNNLSNLSTGFSTLGMVINPVNTAISGTLTLNLENPVTNTWSGVGSFMKIDAGGGYVSTIIGNIALAGPLSQVLFTTTGGTDTFSAGSINIAYY